MNGGDKVERDTASIARFIIDAVGKTSVYYDEIPKDFQIPAIYFPTPNVDSDSDALGYYQFHYIMAVKFFHSNNESAYNMALSAINSIRSSHNYIPVVDNEGIRTGDLLRVSDPNIRKVDSGIYQVEIQWDSIKAYIQ